MGKQGLGVALLGGWVSLWLMPSGALGMSAGEYRALGLQYRQQEQFDAAIAAFQSAVQLDPQNPEGLVLLGWTYHLAGQAEPALDTLQTSALSHPLHAPSWNALGIVYLVQGQLTPMVAAHTWAAWLDFHNEVAYYNLSLAYQRLGVYDRAIEAAQVAIGLEPTNPHPVVALAIAYASQGKSALAQASYRRAIGLDSRYQDVGFLAYLKEAGFSADQIELTQTVAQIQAQ